ncbi:hypothetical protein AK812_SmicGene48291, partial [Symbiodinium microadriaticum]
QILCGADADGRRPHGQRPGSYTRPSRTMAQV